MTAATTILPVMLTGYVGEPCAYQLGDAGRCTTPAAWVLVLSLPEGTGGAGYCTPHLILAIPRALQAVENEL